MPLGSWVLARAAADTARWRRDLRDPRQGHPAVTAGSLAGCTSA